MPAKAKAKSVKASVAKDHKAIEKEKRELQSLRDKAKHATVHHKAWEKPNIMLAASATRPVHEKKSIGSLKTMASKAKFDGQKIQTVVVEDIFPFPIVVVGTANTNAIPAHRGKVCFFDPTETKTDGSAYSPTFAVEATDMGLKVQQELMKYEQFWVEEFKLEGEYAQGVNTSNTQGNLAISAQMDPAYSIATGNWKQQGSGGNIQSGYMPRDWTAINATMNKWSGGLYQPDPKKGLKLNLKMDKGSVKYVNQQAQTVANAYAGAPTGAFTSVIGADIVINQRLTGLFELSVAGSGIATPTTDLMLNQLKFRAVLKCCGQSNVADPEFIGGLYLNHARKSKLYDSGINKLTATLAQVGMVAISDIDGKNVCKVDSDGKLNTVNGGGITPVTGYVSIVDGSGSGDNFLKIQNNAMQMGVRQSTLGDIAYGTTVAVGSGSGTVSVNAKNTAPMAQWPARELYTADTISLKPNNASQLVGKGIVMHTGMCAANPGSSNFPDPVTGVNPIDDEYTNSNPNVVMLGTALGRATAEGNLTGLGAGTTKMALTSGTTQAVIWANGIAQAGFNPGSLLTTNTGSAAVQKVSVVSSDGKNALAVTGAGAIKTNMHSGDGATGLSVSAGGSMQSRIQDVDALVNMATNLATVSSAQPLAVTIYTPSGSTPLNITNGKVEATIVDSKIGGAYAKVDAAGSVQVAVIPPEEPAMSVKFNSSGTGTGKTEAQSTMELKEFDRLVDMQMEEFRMDTAFVQGFREMRKVFGKEPKGEKKDELDSIISEIGKRIEVLRKQPSIGKVSAVASLGVRREIFIEN